MSNFIVNVHMQAIKKFVEIACVHSHAEVRTAIVKMVNDSLEEIGKEFTCLEQENIIERKEGLEINGREVGKVHNDN